MNPSNFTYNYKEKVKGKFSSWLSTIDNKLFFAVLILIGVGLLMAVSAYPIIGDKLYGDSMFFLKRYVMYFIVSIAGLIFFSVQNHRNIKIICLIGFLTFFALLFLTPFIGSLHKGATRWINFGFTNIQPSEILKPFFIVFNALLIVRLKENLKKNNLRAVKNNIFIILFSFALICLLLINQPDFGMLFTYLVIFAGQTFIAGIPWKYLTGFFVMAVSVAVIGYFSFPHFTKRINGFLNPEGTDTYQIDKALNAVKNAGILGGQDNFLIKSVPDIHTDFIFIALYEGFGALGAIAFVGLILFIGFRILEIIKEKKDPFIVYSCFGIATLFLFQCFVNISSSLRLIPTKGMTLPFMSYGGSSYLSFAIVFGILLALLREDLSS